MKFIAIERILPADYKYPNRNSVSGPLLDTLYDVKWNSETRTLLVYSRLLGIFFFDTDQRSQLYLWLMLWPIYSKTHPHCLMFLKDQINVPRVERRMPHKW